MNKKLIALLIATLPAAAMADVSIYGAIKLSLEHAKVGSGSSVNALNDIGSKIGFKGNEDLGNGLKAVWQIESRVWADGTGIASNLATRDTFVGFSDDEMGMIRFGRISNYGNSSMELPDTWAYSNNAVLGLGIFTRADTRLNNSVRYDSPNIGGFSLALQHGFDETTTKKNRTGMGMSYSAGPVTVAYTYQQNTKAVANTSKGYAQRLEVAYSDGPLYLSGGVGKTRDNSSISGTELTTAFGSKATLTAARATAYTNKASDATDMAITANYTMDKITAKVSIAKGQNVKVDGQSLTNTGYKQFVIGADYSLSKRTSTGISYGKLDYAGGSGQDLKAMGVQLVHNF